MTQLGACLSPDQVLAFFAGELTEGEVAELDQHADACPRCCELLAAFARAAMMERDLEAAPTGARRGASNTSLDRPGEVETADRPRLGLGSSVGRYRILEELGAGGMGVVYGAYDPELDRKVAIKLLRVPARAVDEARGRLRREAQALARLSHRNLVQVFDVGICELADGAISFVAMELIRGTTLRNWALQQPRTWPEVVRIYADAARGLAAAHSSGIIHRDFKPSNALIDLEGRVVVVDFGLARFLPGDPSNVSNDSEAFEGGTPDEFAPVDPLVTHSRMLVGTPAYMAPEQRAAAAADARSDQYSLCLAMAEALAPRAPLQRTATDRVAHLRIPRRLAAVLARGLADNPADRYPDLDSLVADLERLDQRHRRVRRVAAVGSALMFAAVGGAVLVSPPSDNCAGAGARIETTWDALRAAALAEALGRFDRPHLVREAARLHERVDAFADEWRVAAAAVCEAQRGGESLDAQTLCLERARAELGATLRAIEVGDAAIAERSVDDIDALLNPRRCVDEPERNQVDSENLEAILEVHTTLAEAHVLERGGRSDEAAARYDDGVDLARRLGDAPTWAEALIVSGSLAMARGHIDDARARLVEALRMSEDAGDDEHVARAAIELCWLEGYFALAFDLAERHCQHARAAIDHGGGDPALHALRERNLAWVALQRDAPADAERGFRAALAELHRAGLDDSRDALLVRLDLGNALLRLDRLDDAEQAFEAVRAAIERELGGDHPELVPVLNNLGAVARMRGDYERAWRLFDRAVAVMSAAHGSTHIVIARALLNRGTAELDLGRTSDARATYERAGQIYRALGGDTQQELARVWKGIAGVDQQHGDYEAARQGFQRALDIEIEVLGPEHHSAAVTGINLAAVLVDLGRASEALPLSEQAVATLEAVLGRDHPDVGVAQITVGLVLEALARREEAERVYARAIEIGIGTESPYLPQAYHRAGMLAIEHGDEGAGVAALERALAVAATLPAADPVLLAQTRFELARVLWRRPNERPRARGLAASAAAALPADAPLRRDVDAWLAARPATARAGRPTALP